ncbi:S8 family serine peptidase [Microbacterium jejuense]|uniref:S8 family serine peptidase n=1 Tax=Microbacterium jejuense TaxID=1263637 RepID=A0ABS7HRE4_9MICO|nr:S8 family peptidase [Microbacterium jejuense]MBW9095541.1 S8 family serine peptidase [Microbacterium jejuense]
MGRTSLRTAAVVTLAALFTGTASASFGAVPEEVNTPVLTDAADGHYIVMLKEAPLATYEGGTNGLQRTKPDKGKQLDTESANSKAYLAHLKKQQDKVAADTGVTADATYGVVANGFSAQLTAAQATKLAGDKNVLGVFPDEIYHPTATPSTEFLGLGSVDTGTGGVWDAVGGVAEAGKGIVVGVVDTGIAPENPSFAGDKLTSKKVAGVPYKSGGNTVVFDKADGGQFRSKMVNSAQEWDKSAYNTKLIGAQYFSAGAQAAGFDFSYDFLSPRDKAGHGSHTASTAAGNFGVDATVEGIDFGKISGVAPAAKVAAYKACYDGPDELVTTDDICAGSDLLSAIDQAVADGVDVINYSIGGGAATSVLSWDDIAFFNAAVAGVFVSVSAGNDGPDASTADHASPWYTTVAASTVPTWEGTVQWDGQQAAGASVSVPFGQSISGPVVYAGDIPLAGADPAEAALCFLGTVDPAQAAGKIVVCDRGSNARVEKSQTVAEAGGIGMVLVNVTPGSLDNDFHSVPTVHLQNTYRAALLDYVQNTETPTVTLVGENVTGVETPTPQIAGFSSRGPILADGSDVIKPDVSGPGVAILAATDNGSKEKPTFGIMSGTSMSSPHVAGLGALYLGERPLAEPSEIKSALMTTAYDLVDAAGNPVTDPFTQGAGHVDPTRYFNPGLSYLNGPADWAAYIEGALSQDMFDGIDPIDPSDLNIASIGIGALAGTQTITRTVTASEAGTYTASIDVPGVDAVVSPSSFTIAAGATQEFTVTFTTTDAPIGEWTSGSLTWTSATNTVRSPIAIQPVVVDAPKSASGTGADGTLDVTVTPGFTGDLPLNVLGLAKADVLIDGDETTGAETDGTTVKFVEVPAGTDVVRFALNSSVDTAGTDLDLTVYKVKSEGGQRTAVWQSATGSADEAVQLVEPEAGWYEVRADVYAFTGPFTWTATVASVTPDGGLGGFAATPDTLAAQQSVPTDFQLSWSGLEAGSYLGVVRYGDSDVRTVVSVDVP